MPGTGPRSGPPPQTTGSGTHETSGTARPDRRPEDSAHTPQGRSEDPEGDAVPEPAGPDRRVGRPVVATTPWADPTATTGRSNDHHRSGPCRQRSRMRPMRPGWFQRSSQRRMILGGKQCVEQLCRTRSPRTIRGRRLSSSSTRARSAGVWTERSVDFGKYWRNRPLVFSFVPRCQGWRLLAGKPCPEMPLTGTLASTRLTRGCSDPQRLQWW